MDTNTRVLSGDSVIIGRVKDKNTKYRVLIIKEKKIIDTSEILDQYSAYKGTNYINAKVEHINSKFSLRMINGKSSRYPYIDEVENTFIILGVSLNKDNSVKSYFVTNKLGKTAWIEKNKFICMVDQLERGNKTYPPISNGAFRDGVISPIFGTYQVLEEDIIQTNTNREYKGYFLSETKEGTFYTFKPRPYDDSEYYWAKTTDKVNWIIVKDSRIQYKFKGTFIQLIDKLEELDKSIKASICRN